MRKLVTQSEYARMRGVKKDAVSKMVLHGVITLNANGKIDPVLADAAIAANTSPARDEYRKIGKETPPQIQAQGEMSYRRAATAEKFWRAKIAEFEAGRLKETLVGADEVKAVFFTHITAVKTRLRSIPSKCAQEVAVLKLSAKSDRELMAQIQQILSAVVDEALNEMSKWKL